MRSAGQIWPAGQGLRDAGLGPTSGGFVSVYLLCVYMCGLRKQNDTKVGCMIGTTLINQLIYADNLVLLSPSAMGLSLLL